MRALRRQAGPPERESSRRSGVRDRARSDALELLESVFPEQKRAAVPAAPAVAPPAEPARPSTMGGPKPATLAIIGAAAVITLSTVAMVLGLIPKPWAAQSEEAVGAVARPIPPTPVAQPANVAKAAVVPEAKAAVVPEAKAAVVPEAKAAEPSPSPSANPPSSAAPVPTPTPVAAPAGSGCGCGSGCGRGSGSGSGCGPGSGSGCGPGCGCGSDSSPVSGTRCRRSSLPLPSRTTPRPLPTAVRSSLPRASCSPPTSPRRPKPCCASSSSSTLQTTTRWSCSPARSWIRIAAPEAVPFARKIVQRRPKRVPYRLLLGDLLLMIGDQAGAHAEWKQALELDPGNAEIQRRLK